MRAAWYYMGPEAAKVPGLTADQVNYAITLRRQLADGLRDRIERYFICRCIGFHLRCDRLRWVGNVRS